MKSGRAILPAPPPPGAVSALDAAEAVGLPHPISLTQLFDLLQVKTFTFTVTTPSPESLGGTVTLTVHGSGRYRLTARMRTSGLPDYSYRLAIQLHTEAGVLAFYSRGSASGTITQGDRAHEDVQEGVSPFVQYNWDKVLSAHFTVSKEYENHLTGWIESALLDIVTFVVGAATLGGATVLIIVLATATEDITGLNLPGEIGLAGIIAAGGAFFLLGPAAVIPVFIAGAIISAAAFERRDLTPKEIAAARSVFRDTIRYDKVSITNLATGGGRAFCAQSIDGTIMIGMGSRFAAPIEETRGTFIHEMTHAWQIEHESTLTTLCDGTATRVEMELGDREAVYSLDPPNSPGIGAAWGAFNREQQAELIKLFDTIRAIGRPTPIYLHGDNDEPPEVLLPPRNPLSRYVVEHILLGRT